jgi:hypothetical protein
MPNTVATLARRILAVLLFGGMLCAQAADMVIPAKLQAMIIKKVVGFDQALASKPAFKVAVVYSAESELVANELAREFGSNGISAETVPVTGLAGKIAGCDVVYLCPGTASAKSTVDGSGKLSVSGVPAFVNNGTVSVAIGEADGKPSILIHQGRLAQEKHEFSSKLLKLATVVG